ncbi:MAG: TRAP transporter substrate-binding protein DctP [Treponema sp.]|nr:TRAP transporter substrate-binding protein DctP [Treponema sp.]
MKKLTLKKTLVYLALSCCAFFAAANGNQEQSQGAGHGQAIKIASVAPNNSPWDVEQKKLAQEWARITENQVILQFFDATALGGEGGVIQKLRTVRPGQRAPLDGAIFTSLGISQLAPDSHVLTFCVPFMFRNQDEVDYIFDLFSPEIQQAIKDKGYVLLGWFNVGWIYFSTKESAETPEKLKNLKLAMGGMDSPELNTAFKTAGFKLEAVSADKLAQNLKAPGGVQGVYGIPMYTYATKFYESLPYILDVPICPILAAFVISENTWNAIPESYKLRMREAVKKSQQVFMDVQRETDKQYLDLMEKAGVTRVKPVGLAHWEDVLQGDARKMADTGSTVINRDSYYRIESALEEYRAAHQSER